MNVFRSIAGRLGAALRSFSNPSGDVLRAFGYQPSRAGVDVNEQTAMSASAVFACVRNLGEDVAKLPVVVYRDNGDDGKEQLPGHPLYRLLHESPNPEQTAFEVRQTLTAIAVLYGNGRAEIERTKGGRPVALWPIPPWRIRPKRTAGGTLFYEVDGSTPLAQEDVLDIRGFSVVGVVGEMIAKMGRESIGLAIAAERFAAGFFGNGAINRGVYQHPGKLSKNAHDNLRGSLTEKYAGVDNAHKPLILEEGMIYQKTSSDPEEAQMLETRAFQVEDVARWFRMPPHKIGHLKRATGWSTLEATNADYLIDTLMPWFTRWEQESKRKLIGANEAAVYLSHVAGPLLMGNMGERFAAYNAALASGWMTIDEVRRMENLNPVSGGFGGKNRVPLNMVSIDKADAAPAPVDAPPPMAVPSKPPAGTDRALRELAADAARRVLRVEIDKVRRAAKSHHNGEFAAWVETFYGAHAEHVGRVLGPVARAMGRSDYDAAGYVADAKRELLAAGADVEAVLSRWESDKPGVIALALAPEN